MAAFAARLAVSFASEQAIDQLAYLANMDPLEFRRNITRSPLAGRSGRSRAGRRGSQGSRLRAVSAEVVIGRGIGVGTHLVSYGGAVAEIEVDRQTGNMVAKHIYGALEPVSPSSGTGREPDHRQLVQATSRMLKEEVTLNRTGSPASIGRATRPAFRRAP